MYKCILVKGRGRVYIGAKRRSYGYIKTVVGTTLCCYFVLDFLSFGLFFCVLHAYHRKQQISFSFPPFLVISFFQHVVSFTVIMSLYCTKLPQRLSSRVIYHSLSSICFIYKLFSTHSVFILFVYPPFCYPFSACYYFSSCCLSSLFLLFLFSQNSLTVFMSFLMFIVVVLLIISH